MRKYQILIPIMWVKIWTDMLNLLTKRHHLHIGCIRRHSIRNTETPLKIVDIKGLVVQYRTKIEILKLIANQMHSRIYACCQLRVLELSRKFGPIAKTDLLYGKKYKFSRNLPMGHFNLDYPLTNRTFFRSF